MGYSIVTNSKTYNLYWADEINIVDLQADFSTLVDDLESVQNFSSLDLAKGYLSCLVENCGLVYGCIVEVDSLEIISNINKSMPISTKVVYQVCIDDEDDTSDEFEHIYN